MSHIVDAKLDVNDLDALEQAAPLCGLRLERGKTTHAWFGQFVGDSESGREAAARYGAETFGKCDHALMLQDAREGDYEIGVVANPDGSYRMLYDTWGPGARLVAAAGHELAKLRVEYAAAVAERRAASHLARHGFKTTRENLLNGGVRIVLSRR